MFSEMRHNVKLVLQLATRVAVACAEIAIGAAVPGNDNSIRPAKHTAALAKRNDIMFLLLLASYCSPFSFARKCRTSLDTYSMNDGQFDPESDSSKDWFAVSGNEPGLLRIGTILRIVAKWKPVLDSGSATRSMQSISVR